jgi:hypothetical protein
MISCHKIFFNEEESKREIGFKDFHAVKISGIYNIIFIQDSTNHLVITGKNDINSIDALVKEDTLIIDDHKNMYFNPEKNTLSIHFSDIEYMEFHDPVNVSNADTIKADQLSLIAVGEIAEVRLVFKCNHFLVVNDANTLGYFHFIGKAESCWFWNRYGSCMYADSLLCKTAVIYNQSVGVVNVNASENIEAYIWGTGNIGYYGSPVIKIAEQKGTGKIIRLN